MLNAVPNALMIRVLTVIEEGGTANLDAEELAIAVAVGVKNGWLTNDRKLTETGRAFTVKGTAAPEYIPRPMAHPLLDAVRVELGCEDVKNGREAF